MNNDLQWFYPQLYEKLAQTLAFTTSGLSLTTIMAGNSFFGYSMERLLSALGPMIHLDIIEFEGHRMNVTPAFKDFYFRNSSLPYDFPYCAAFAEPPLMKRVEESRKRRIWAKDAGGISKLGRYKHYEWIIPYMGSVHFREYTLWRSQEALFEIATHGLSGVA